MTNEPLDATGAEVLSLPTTRKAQKLSLEAAATLIGCTKSHLWNLEKGNSLPGLVMAYRMAETYGVPLLTLALCASEVPETAKEAA